MTTEQAKNYIKQAIQEAKSDGTIDDLTYWNGCYLQTWRFKLLKYWHAINDGAILFNYPIIRITLKNDTSKELDYNGNLNTLNEELDKLIKSNIIAEIIYIPQNFMIFEKAFKEISSETYIADKMLGENNFDESIKKLKRAYFWKRHEIALDAGKVDRAKYFLNQFEAI